MTNEYDDNMHGEAGATRDSVRLRDGQISGSTPDPRASHYDDKLPDGTPCLKDEVAGLGCLNMGRNDPFRKAAVMHDRLYDGIREHTSDITQEEADRYFLEAMLAEADKHQLGKARAYFRYGVVKLVSMFRKVE